jgi:diguanylate cyclase (GGDEF)-like protein
LNLLGIAGRSDFSTILNLSLAPACFNRKVIKSGMYCSMNEAIDFDGLSGVYSPRGLAAHLQRSEALARRHERELGLMVFDIDDLASINETLGHGTGDDVIRIIARTSQQSLRMTDVIGRVGGGRFAIILPETSVAEAVTAAERLRRKIELLTFPQHSASLEVTASFGVAVFLKEDSSYEELVKRAEAAMYEAKRNGRNTVAVAPRASRRALKAVS